MATHIDTNTWKMDWNVYHWFHPFFPNNISVTLRAEKVSAIE